MKTKKTVSLLAAVSLMVVFNGCTRPDETTAVGAAAGGVLGAGLGAIVGNQTGDPATGLAIGAVAGASAGAAVGNALQAQKEAIRTQDEALERQEKIIQVQKAELQELRRMRADGSDATRAARLPGSFPGEARAKLTKTTQRPGRTAVAERDLLAGAAAGEKAARGSLNWSKPSGDDAADSKRGAAPVTAKSAALGVKPLSDDCRNAFAEALKAQRAADKSRKLFHYRLALRLCPEEPSFHNGVGEAYLALNRQKDAAFEFKEALKLNPEYQPAKKNLISLKKY